MATHPLKKGVFQEVPHVEVASWIFSLKNTTFPPVQQAQAAHFITGF
jgi:hypothetical protein